MGMWIVLLVVVALIVWLVLRSRKWHTVLRGSGNNAPEVEAKYAYLKSNGVKCKLKSEAAAGMGAIQGVEGSSASLTLKVHEKDAERAAVLLEQYEKESNVLKL